MVSHTAAADLQKLLQIMYIFLNEFIVKIIFTVNNFSQKGTHRKIST